MICELETESKGITQERQLKKNVISSNSLGQDGTDGMALCSGQRLASRGCTRTYCTMGGLQTEGGLARILVGRTGVLRPFFIYCTGCWFGYHRLSGSDASRRRYQVLPKLGMLP
jgi:hypothetical protein